MIQYRVDNNLGTVLMVKLIAMLSIALVCIIFAGIPFKLKKRQLDQARTLSVANCLSGGIFLGFAALHILPETVSDFNIAVNDGNVEQSSIPYLACLCGFFTVLLVEKILYVKVLRRDIKMKEQKKAIDNVMEVPDGGIFLFNYF
jgi:hypothetical protein